MAEPAKNFLQQTIDWFSGAIASVGDLAKRVGWLLTALIVLRMRGEGAPRAAHPSRRRLRLLLRMRARLLNRHQKNRTRSAKRIDSSL
jgi:hypothetical protein